MDPSKDEPDLKFIEDNFSAGYGDLSIGVLYKSHINKYSKIEIGVAALHIQNPSFTFGNGGGVNKIGRRINFHTKYRRATSRRMTWEPSIYYSIFSGANNTQIQLRNEYLFKKKGDLSIITGIGFRIGDSAQILTGARYRDWLVSLSFDIGVSKLSEPGLATSIELGVQKRFIINKKPKVDPIIYCPRI